MKLKNLLSLSMDCSSSRRSIEDQQGPRDFHKVYKMGGVLGKEGSEQSLLPLGRKTNYMWQ